MLQNEEEVKVVKVENNKKIKEKKRKNKPKKSENKKMGKFELTFNILSLIFLIGFTCFYGYRLIHYKKIFTPTTSTGKSVTLLTTTLKSSTVTSGEGLYAENRSFIYKGEAVNNYLVYSNLLWRITKINSDGSIEIVLDDYLNYLAIDKTEINFVKSDLSAYLNDVFLNKLNKSLLTKSIICEDIVSDLNNITCTDKNSSNYVKLLTVSDYFSSKKDEKSYLNSESEVWLYSTDGEKIYLMNNSNLSLSEPNELYQVKPVVVLNNTVGVYSGDGTEENPYTVEEKTGYFASYVKLGEDLFRVYEVNDNKLKMIMNDLYKDGSTKYQFSINKNIYNLDEVGLGKYLNSAFLEEISYSEYLVECDWYIGKYDRNYENVLADKITTKVGLYTMIDPIFNKSASNYYLSTPYEENEEKYTYIFNNEQVYAVRPNLVRNVRPAVCIDSDILTIGTGSIEDPYTVSSNDSSEVTE